MTVNSKWSLGFASCTGDFIVAIPKGSPLPARRSVSVTTAVDSQMDMKLSIYMGESNKAGNNYPLSNIKLDCFEKGAAGVPRVKLTFYAYEHSVFRIGVCYREGEPEQEISIIPATGLSEEDMNRLRELVNKMTSQTAPQEVEGGDLGVIPLSVV
jgi:molecular chaperone DnaK (HSP70)